VGFIPLPSAFPSQRYWGGDLLQAVQNQDLVCLSCTEAAGGHSCDRCEDTSRPIVIFSRDNDNSGEAIGCAPWAAILEKMMSASSAISLWV